MPNLDNFGKQVPVTSALCRKWLFWRQICLPKESRCFSHKHLIGKFNEIRLQQGDALIISYPHTRMRPLNRLPLPHLQCFSCAHLYRPTMYIWNIHICQLKSPNEGWCFETSLLASSCICSAREAISGSRPSSQDPLPGCFLSSRSKASLGPKTWTKLQL